MAYWNMGKIRLNNKLTVFQYSKFVHSDTTTTDA